MIKRLLYTITFLIIGYSCNPYRKVGMPTFGYYNDEINFRSLDFIKTFNSISKSNELYIYNYTRFSQDSNYQIVTTFKPFPIGKNIGKCFSHLYRDSALLNNINWTLIDEKIYWLDSSLVFFGYNSSSDIYSRKILVNLNHSTPKYIKSSGKFTYLGRTKDKLFFETLDKNQYLDDIVFPEPHTIYSIGYNEIQIEKHPNEKTYLFFNNSNNLYFDSSNKDYLLSNNKEFEPMKIKNPVIYEYWDNDTSYLLIDREKLIIATLDNIRLFCTLDLKKLEINSINEFAIRQNKMILSYYKDYTDNGLNKKNTINTNNGLTYKYLNIRQPLKTIAIIDLNTNNIQYPKIKIINK